MDPWSKSDSLFPPIFRGGWARGGFEGKMQQACRDVSRGCGEMSMPFPKGNHHPLPSMRVDCGQYRSYDFSVCFTRPLKDRLSSNIKMEGSAW